MTCPLVSIIIPVYNVEPYLWECLESCVGQTYKNIEVLAINDGSSDHSLDILQQYAQKYINIHVINQENAGNSVARNQGLERSRGKYIYFLDADDYILPETIKNLVEAMEKNHLDIIRFSAEPFFDGIEADYHIINQYDYSKFFEVGKVYEKAPFLQASIKGFSASPCLYLIKREILIKHHIRFKPGMRHEDELFSCELYLNTNRAMYDPTAYYKRRYRQGSIMTSQTQRQTNQQSFDAYETLVGEIGQLMDIYQSPIEQKFIKSRIRSIYIGMVTKEIDPRYKKEKLEKLAGLSSVEKKFYLVQYKVKELIKKRIGRR